ncbi:MAG: hypothetical protein AB7F25_03515 [Deferribacterales bacterium]
MNKQTIKAAVRRICGIIFRIPYGKRVFFAIVPEVLAEKMFLRLGIPSIKPSLSRDGRGVLKRLKDIRSGRT